MTDRETVGIAEALASPTDAAIALGRHGSIHSRSWTNGVSRRERFGAVGKQLLALM